MDPILAQRMERELLGKPVGDWIPDKLLGNGKSALVLRATRSGQVAALKVFDPDLVRRFGEDAQLERIARERLLIGRKYENLVEIYDGGKCGATGYLFVAMQCVDAPDLAAALTEVPQDRIRPLIAQLAVAAQFLEGLGLVHRDIKPANIAVSTDYQLLTLLDLGVIRPVGDGALTDTEGRVFVGTHQYSPPEFMLRKEKDSVEGWRAVSFYQIGAVLHDLITRKPLFSEFCTPSALLVQAVQHETPPIDGAGIDPDLVLLAKNCLVKDPELRLRLVRWDSFSSSPPPVSVASLRDRARRILATEAAPATQEEAAAVNARVRLHELVGQIQAMIRKECFENADLFPAVEVHDHPSDSAAPDSGGRRLPGRATQGLPLLTGGFFRRPQVVAAQRVTPGAGQNRTDAAIISQVVRC